MSWKEVNIIDALEIKGAFLDEYGFCQISYRGITINDKALSEFYRYNDKIGKFELLRENRENFSNFIKTLFSSKLAVEKNKPNNVYRSRMELLDCDNVTEVKVKKVNIYLRTTYWESFDNGRTNVAEDTIELNNPSDLDKYICWVPNDRSFVLNKLAMVCLSKIKVGDTFCLIGSGKVKVTKLYDYPNENDRVCEVQDGDGQLLGVTRQSEIYHLPYEKEDDEYDEVNHSVNELLLSPFVERSKETQTYNIYWDKADAASVYYVLVYKVIPIKNRRRVLHIATYEVDRNTNYLALNNLVGDNFIFKVKAEDRNGNVLAESRGSSSGLPKEFHWY